MGTRVYRNGLNIRLILPNTTVVDIPLDNFAFVINSTNGSVTLINTSPFAEFQDLGPNIQDRSGLKVGSLGRIEFYLNILIGVQGSVGSIFGSVIEPPALSSNQDDYSPAGLLPGVRIKQDFTTDVDITGFDATTMSDGSIIGFLNTSVGSTGNFKKNDGSSAAGNRLLIKNDIQIDFGFGCIWMYDGTALPNSGFRILTEIS